MDNYVLYVSNNASKTITAGMVLKEDYLQREVNLKFVVEYWLSSEQKNDEQSCMANSSSNLRYLIHRCYENVRLREPTNEELSEVQRFEDDYKRKLLLGIRF